MAKADLKHKYPKMEAGQRYGKLVAVRCVQSGSHPKWLFLCDCGRKHAARQDHVKNGMTCSCGCEQGKTIHNMAGTPEYKAWMAMKQRCYNSSDANFRHYGGRGITVCERWMGGDAFTTFLSDMGPKPSPTHSLDRKNNDLGYSPENCWWAPSRKAQMRNTRRNRLVVFRGTKMIFQDACILAGINVSTAYGRLAHKWPIDSIFSTPVIQSRYRKRN